MTVPFKILLMLKLFRVYKIFFRVVNMSSFEPNEEHLQHALILFFIQKKSASESHCFLVKMYSNNVPTQDARLLWFRRFKSGNFDLKDNERPGQPKNFKDDQLQALSNKGDTQTQQEVAEVKYWSQNYL